MAKSSVLSKLFLVVFICGPVNLVPANALATNVSVDCLINVGVDLMKCAIKCGTRICFRLCAAKMAPEVALCINPAPGPGPSPTPTPTPSPSPPPMRTIEAVAMVGSPSEGNRIRGSLRFLQHRFHPAKTYIRGRIIGLEPRKLHGLHIHFNGSCAGDHRNHQGSSYLGLGNVVANARGVAEFYDAKSSLRVVGGSGSVLGHALVVHHLGSAKRFGKRCTEKALACGVIHLSKA